MDDTQRKWVGSVLAIAMLAGWSLYKYTRPPSLDTARVEKLIVKELAENGMAGVVDCPDWRMRKGERIACRVTLAGGEVVNVGLVAVGDGKVKLIPEEILYHEMMVRAVATLDVPINEVDCPPSRVFRKGDVASCMVTTDDGGAFPIEIHYESRDEITSHLGERVLETESVATVLENEPALKGYQVDCGPRYRELKEDGTWSCKAKRRDMTLYVQVSGKPNVGAFEWKVE